MTLPTPRESVLPKIDTRVPIVMWSTSPGSLSGLDAAVFIRIDGVNRVHDLAEAIGAAEEDVAASIARLAKIGLLTFLPSAAEQQRNGRPAELAGLLPDETREEIRDTLPDAPSAPAVVARAPQPQIPRRQPPPLPARALRAGRGQRS